VVGKPQIIEELGEEALLLPDAVGRALTANDRVKYCLALLQMAERHAESPDASLSSLRSEREAAGIDDASLDAVVLDSRRADGGLHIPQAARLHRLIVESLDEMIVPLGVTETKGGRVGAAALYRDRSLLSSLPPVAGELVPPGYVAGVARVREGGPDSLHRLIMDLHRELNQLQGLLSRESIAGASVYGLAPEDRPLVAAFMAGVNRTAALKFEHPGLGTTATRRGQVLLIQNDIGETDTHVLVARVEGLGCTLVHADPHLQRARFFQGLLARFGVQWSDTLSRESKGSDEPYYLCTGKLAARDPAELERFLELLGSRIVFLIDWNRARKRLRNFVDGPGCAEVLQWAADQDVGHRAFLELGGERLLYEAVEHASPSPVRYGERLDEILGREAVVDFLKFVLKATSEGLLQHRSERFIRDEIRADLIGRFETMDQGLLAMAAEHALLIGEVAGAVRQGLLAGPEGSGELPSLARRAAAWEKRADAIVDRARWLARRSPGANVYANLLSEADDAVDGLEEAAFLMTLAPGGVGREPFQEPLQALGALLVSGTQEWVKCLESAAHVKRGAAREDLQDFLEAIDRVVTVEHQTDDAQRAVTRALFRHAADWRQFSLLGLISQSLEESVDALARCALLLRDHFLGEVMTG
jgi:hypothetical protein